MPDKIEEREDFGQFYQGLIDVKNPDLRREAVDKLFREAKVAKNEILKMKEERLRAIKELTKAEIERDDLQFEKIEIVEVLDKYQIQLSKEVELKVGMEVKFEEMVVANDVEHKKSAIQKRKMRMKLEANRLDITIDEEADEQALNDFPTNNSSKMIDFLKNNIVQNQDLYFCQIQAKNEEINTLNQQINSRNRVIGLMNGTGTCVPVTGTEYVDEKVELQ